MKLFSLMLLLAASFSVSAQNMKLHVVLKEGKRSLLTGFRVGYNAYYFSGGESGKTDTLICSGKGFAPGKVNRTTASMLDETTRPVYKTFNKAIRKGRRKASRMVSGSGTFSFRSGREFVTVNYLKNEAVTLDIMVDYN